MNEHLDFAIKTAQSAGDILMKYYGSKLTKTIKSAPEDFVTEADFASEKFIIEKIKQHYPNDSIVAEESGKNQNPIGNTWIVDPLDGTYHFARGVDNFGVLIARAKDGKIELAVAYMPTDQTLATAILGEGAFLNGKQVYITMDETSNKPIVANIELHNALETLGQTWSDKSAIKSTIKSLQGEYKANVANKGSIWDHAPAALMLAEAGWKVTNYSGENFKWDGQIKDSYPGIIAASAELHDQLVKTLHS